MGSKIKILLLVLLLFGAPALVTSALITADYGHQVTAGAQPGGTIRGAVHDEAAGRELSGVRVQLAFVSELEEKKIGAKTSTDASGRFEIAAPPCQGHYELWVGGGDWQTTAQGVSFLDRSGNTIEPKPVRIVLQPACRLELDFVHPDGRPPGNGEYTLGGEFGSGFLFGLVKPRLRKSGTIHDGALDVDGLPPMKADVSAQMESGETVELTIELVPGPNKKRIEL